MEKESYYETKKCRCLSEYYPIQSSDLYLTMCGVECCTPDKSYGPASRPGYHLHAVLSGEGTLVVQDQRTRLHAGQLFLEKPNEQTHYYPDKADPWIYCWMTFDGSKASYYMEEAGFSAGVNTLNSYIDVSEFYRLADLVLTRPELTLAGDLRRQGLLCAYVSLALESYSRAVRAKRPPNHVPGTYIDHALDYIWNNYSSITVADISNYIGINRSYFSKLFQQHMNTSPQEYLLSVRMWKSAQLLSNTDLSIRVISEMVGYENPLTFSKAFKHIYGVSPKYYREQPEEQRIVLDVKKHR